MPNYKSRFEIKKLIKQEGPWSIAIVFDINDPSKKYLLFKFAIIANKDKAEADYKKFNQELHYLKTCLVIKNPLLLTIHETEDNPDEKIWLTELIEGVSLSRVLEMGKEAFSLEQAITLTYNYAELVSKSNYETNVPFWFTPPFESNLIITNTGQIKILPLFFKKIITGSVAMQKSVTISDKPDKNVTVSAKGITVPIKKEYDKDTNAPFSPVQSLIGLLFYLLSKTHLSTKKSYYEQVASLKNILLPDELENLIRSAIEGKELPFNNFQASVNSLLSQLESVKKQLQSGAVSGVKKSKAATFFHYKFLVEELKNKLLFFITYRLLQWKTTRILMLLLQGFIFTIKLFFDASKILLKTIVSFIIRFLTNLRSLTWQDVRQYTKEQIQEAKIQYKEFIKTLQDILQDVLIPLDQQLVVFTREIALMLKAGLPYARAFSILHKQTVKPSLKEAIYQTYLAISSKGITLSTALSFSSKIFSTTYVNIVKAGETTGSVDASLNKIADLLEKNLTIKRRIKAALTYPMFVLGVCLLVFIIFANYVLPVFVQLFESSNIQLPLPTKVLIWIIKFTHNPTSVILFFIFSLIFIIPLIYYKQTQAGSLLFDKIKFKIPIIGKLLKFVALSQFCRTLASLYSCGIQLINAVTISGRSVGNSYLSQIAVEMGELIRAGGSFSQMFLVHDLFPKFVYHMALVGDETGETQEMLEKVSYIYDQEVEHSIEVLMALLDPILIAILGVVVLFVVLALFLPIYQLLQIQ